MTIPRRLCLLVVAAVTALTVAAAFYQSASWARYDGRIREVEIDVSRPDMLIATGSLSSLPRDLLSVPLLRDLLREDLVFYYEQHPDLLGLDGTLRRIAYEHDLTLSDRIVSWVLDQPAEVLLFRGPRGSLDHWVAALTRPELARIFEKAAAVALKDRDLTHAGRIGVDGAAVDLYALGHAPGRALLLAAHGDRVLVMSDIGILLDPQGDTLPDREAFVAQLLSGEAGRQEVYRRAFALPAAVAGGHSLVVRTHFLSFGYQRFFPGIEALRFDFGEEGWATHALLDGEQLPPASFDDRELWKALPANPALCALLPVDWAPGQELAGEGGDLALEMEGPAAACWYGDGRLHTPLFAARLKQEGGDLDPLFAALFDWSVAPAASPKKGPRTKLSQVGVSRWHREIAVPGGTLRVTLARKGRYVFFSPEAERVAQALATLEKRYPSVGETLAGTATTLAVLAPASLGAIGRKEALLMLPGEDEPVFRDAAERLLLPRLEAIAKYPAYRLTLSAQASPTRRWEAVAWQELTP